MVCAGLRVADCADKKVMTLNSTIIRLGEQWSVFSLDVFQSFITENTGLAPGQCFAATCTVHDHSPSVTEEVRMAERPELLLSRLRGPVIIMLSTARSRTKAATNMQIRTKRGKALWVMGTDCARHQV